jgi:hypothetical protein
MPVIHSYIKLIRRQGIHLILIQDGAPGYATRETKEDLQEYRIIIIF